MSTKLTNNQIRRYSRHLILDKIGLDIQRRICASSVLVIGAGGLGSPVLMSLAGAGIGKIGVVDPDTVSFTNLHRQTIYKQADESKLKAECAKNAIEGINPTIKVKAFIEKLGTENALELIEQYDIIADCTDNMHSRYVINDYSVFAGKPLISAAAIGVEGQMTVYNYKDGPCLRCLFPEKSPSDTVKNCSDNGVFGPVPSIMGSLQGLEILKVAGDFGETLSSKLLYFNGISGTFKTITTRNKNCPLCTLVSDYKAKKVTKDEVLNKIKNIDKNEPICTEKKRYEENCKKVKKISCKDFKTLIDIENNKKPFVLVDVRDEAQFKICKLPMALNIPLWKIEDNPSGMAKIIDLNNKERFGIDSIDPIVYVMCRRGISSVAASIILQESTNLNIINVSGGVESWAKEVDPDFPTY